MFPIHFDPLNALMKVFLIFDCIHGGVLQNLPISNLATEENLNYSRVRRHNIQVSPSRWTCSHVKGHGEKHIIHHETHNSPERTFFFQFATRHLWKKAGRRGRWDERGDHTEDCITNKMTLKPRNICTRCINVAWSTLSEIPPKCTRTCSESAILTIREQRI